MKQLISSVSAIRPAQRKAVGAAYKSAQEQATLKAAPALALAGSVPGDRDQRKFLTGPFANMRAVHTATTSTLAYTTNDKDWRDYAPARFEGIHVPLGEGSSKPFYYSDLSADPFVETVATEEVPATRAVILNRSTATAFTINTLQETQK